MWSKKSQRLVKYISASIASLTTGYYLHQYLAYRQEKSLVNSV